MKRLISTVFVFLLVASCVENRQISNEEPKPLSAQDSARISYLWQRVNTQNLLANERQVYLDSILQIQPNNAYIWQQKAMPCFKSSKYELGMSYLDEAVRLKPEEYLEYRAFIKCIFSKQYSDAILDFEEAKKRFGDSYVMDHSYDFFIGLSHLQLNQFQEAQSFLKLTIDRESKEHGVSWVHNLDFFYLGIAEFELGNYNKAVDAFDNAMLEYPKFSDALYYKAKALLRLNRIEEAKECLRNGYEYLLEGNTINDTNAVYENYPYQVKPVFFENFVD